ncbi:MAG: IS200/IS605 family transposase [Capsulimonadaceae bacterium]
MSRSRQELLYHFVWTTWDRLPLLEGAVEDRAHAAIRRHCGVLSASACAVGGTPNHVHVLASLPPAICIEEFVRSVKDASARALMQTFGSSVTAFRWQLGFTVFTVSPSHRRKVCEYIVTQKDLHAAGTLWRGCEP